MIGEHSFNASVMDLVINHVNCVARIKFGLKISYTIFVKKYNAITKKSDYFGLDYFLLLTGTESG